MNGSSTSDLSDDGSICPVCDVDCTCDQRMNRRRRSSVSVAPADVFGSGAVGRRTPSALLERQLSSPAIGEHYMAHAGSEEDEQYASAPSSPGALSIPAAHVFHGGLAGASSVPMRVASAGPTLQDSVAAYSLPPSTKAATNSAVRRGRKMSRTMSAVSVSSLDSLGPSGQEFGVSMSLPASPPPAGDGFDEYNNGSTTSGARSNRSGSSSGTGRSPRKASLPTGTLSGSGASGDAPARKKEERIINCHYIECDKTYTTMAGLRYHMKTFDHTNMTLSSARAAQMAAAAAAAAVAAAAAAGSGGLANDDSSGKEGAPAAPATARRRPSRSASSGVGAKPNSREPRQGRPPIADEEDEDEEEDDTGHRFEERMADEVAADPEHGGPSSPTHGGRINTTIEHAAAVIGPFADRLHVVSPVHSPNNKAGRPVVVAKRSSTPVGGVASTAAGGSGSEGRQRPASTKGARPGDASAKGRLPSSSADGPGKHSKSVAALPSATASRTGSGHVTPIDDSSSSADSHTGTEEHEYDYEEGVAESAASRRLIMHQFVPTTAEHGLAGGDSLLSAYRGENDAWPLSVQVGSLKGFHDGRMPAGFGAEHDQADDEGHHHGHHTTYEHDPTNHLRGAIAGDIHGHFGRIRVDGGDIKEEPTGAQEVGDDSDREDGDDQQLQMFQHGSFGPAGGHAAKRKRGQTSSGLSVNAPSDGVAGGGHDISGHAEDDYDPGRFELPFSHLAHPSSAADFGIDKAEAGLMSMTDSPRFNLIGKLGTPLSANGGRRGSLSRPGSDIHFMSSLHDFEAGGPPSPAPFASPLLPAALPSPVIPHLQAGMFNDERLSSFSLDHSRADSDWNV